MPLPSSHPIVSLSSVAGIECYKLIDTCGGSVPCFNKIARMLRGPFPIAHENSSSLSLAKLSTQEEAMAVSGPRHRGLIIMRTYFTWSFNWKLRRQHGNYGSLGKAYNNIRRTPLYLMPSV